MAMTPSGMPYPVGTDKVVDGDDAIKALALAITKPTIATFAARTDLWANTSGAPSAPRLSRVAGRWMFSWQWSNIGAGTFSAGMNPLGSIPAEARSGTGIIQTAAKLFGVPNYAATIVSLDTESGTLDWFLPLTTTVAAGGLQGSCEILWDAEVS